MEYMYLKDGERVEFIDKDGKPPIPHNGTVIDVANTWSTAKTVVLIWEDAK